MYHRAQSTHDDDREAPSRELVDHGEHKELAFVLGLILQAVVAPGVVRPLWPQTDARSVVEPEMATFRLFFWTFSPSRRQML